MVGLVRCGRNHLRFKGILSGAVGFVRWCRNGPWEIVWDFSCYNSKLGEWSTPGSSFMDESRGWRCSAIRV